MSNMTPNQMRAKAKKLEAEGGNQDQINMLLDRANEEEQKAYEENRKGGNYKKGGMISEYGGAEKYKSKAAKKKHEKKESPSMEMAENVASKAVKAHEKRMHKGMSGGGSVRGDGCATRGKTKGRMV